MDIFSSPARALILALIAGSVGLGVIACGNGQTEKDVEVVNPRLVKAASGERSFTGTLVNRRPNTLSIAQIEVAFYNESGSPVETMRFDVNDVPSQDSVSFSEKIDSDKPFRQAQVQSILTP